jgi:protoheme IX farnesyltransferase
MLPVTHGEYVTKVHIIIYTAILAVVSVFPYLAGMSGPLYLASALALGAGFLIWSSLLMFKQKPTTAIETFRYSIVYLALLFFALLVDHYLF